MIYLLVLLSGAAALSWETLWQIEASLALGVSAMGTAIALVATMGGMTIGSLLMGRFMGQRSVQEPQRLFAALELVIGLSGLLLKAGFAQVTLMDRAIWQGTPALAPALYLLAILAVMGPASVAMGATLPVFGRLARDQKTSLSTLYALNTTGAAVGVLLVSFAVLPLLGVELSAILLSCVNLTVAALAFTLLRPHRAHSEPPATDAAEFSVARDDRVTAVRFSEYAIVFMTGFVTLGLEVTWFRALRAAFWSTTDSFAIMLTAVLVPLAAGASVARWATRHKIRAEQLLVWGGVAVLLSTPVLERFDLFFAHYAHAYPVVAATRLATSLLTLGPAVVLLGGPLPLLLDRHTSSHAWAGLYAASTLGSVLGSLGAAWILLPAIGSERSAWLMGALACAAAITLIDVRRQRWLLLLLSSLALVIAVAAQSGVGRTRVQGVLQAKVIRLLAAHDGPDATIAVADDADGDRVLAIDGFSATSQGQTTHYMEWMGRLPMLLHPNPERALVICFGTGQTANGVRNENPGSLDIVELSAGVFSMAGFFSSNGGVLHDRRVHPVVMDGRAWLRRTTNQYDVITLEPMPPNFAGVNALYSTEFYQLAAERLRPGGVVTQWLPFHLLSLEDAGAIVATFQRTFPDALLWIDPVDLSGVLVGRVQALEQPLGDTFPGLMRGQAHGNMSAEQIKRGVALRSAGLKLWADVAGDIITDDNQLLAYGLHRSLGVMVASDHMTRHLGVVRWMQQHEHGAPKNPAYR
ncbi:MAG TPA: fused MFS/spermidine synthase [Polyangiaceae bacterium]|nr:fused MFS/spermidine synthase [Polyangiaceae bacterium]